MVDVGSEREGVAEPRDIVQDVILFFVFVFLPLLVVLVLTHNLSHIHTYRFGKNSRLTNT